MATHLGRNPFANKSTKPAAVEQKLELESVDSQEKTLGERILVDLPAGTVLLALKTVFLIKGLMKKDAK